MMQDTTTYL